MARASGAVGGSSADHIVKVLDLPGIAEPEIEIFGRFPGPLRGNLAFSTVLATSARQAEAGKALIRFLLTPAAMEAIRAKGMDPGAAR